MEDRRITITSHTVAVLALFATSLMVRVLPVFLSVRMSEGARGLLERVLPMAVFLNFAVYIAWTEIRTAPVPAIAAIVVVGVTTLATRAGLVLITCAGTLVYALIQRVAHS
jgi:hypothetical protein